MPLPPETIIPVVPPTPVEVDRDARASEAGSGGCPDAANTTDFDTVATINTGTDYADRSGDNAEDTGCEKVGTPCNDTFSTHGVIDTLISA